jgi:hypothetical protein
MDGRTATENIVPVYRDGLNVQEIECQWFFDVAAREWAAEKGGAVRTLFNNVAHTVADSGWNLTDDDMDMFCSLARMYLTDHGLDGLHVISYADGDDD